MDVSVIIVNYNTKQLLSDCLCSIFEQTKNIEFEVIVSDNGSTDGSIEMVREQFPQVVLIENNANLGFGKANNIASKVAKGKYLFFLNSDTILLNDAVSIFYEKINSAGSEIILASYLLNANQEKTISYGNFMTPISFLKRVAFLYWPGLSRIASLFRKQEKEIYNEKQVDFVSGADLFISKELFSKLQGFDEQIFMYCEDEDLCRRASLLGVSSLLITEPNIIHLEGQSSKVSKRKRNMMAKSYLYYIKKLLFRGGEI